MAEVAAVAAVYGLITGSIAIVRLSIDIYSAVEDKSGIPERLRKVSEKLQPLEGLLRNAQDRYDGEQLSHQIWEDAENDFKRCNGLCEDLHGLLAKAYPTQEDSKAGRLWKNTKTVLSGKGKTAEQLLKEIWDYLDVFAKKGIITNTALLREIKEVVDELSPQSGNTFNHSGIGDQVACDKINGNQYKQGDNGRQIFGSIVSSHADAYQDSQSVINQTELPHAPHNFIQNNVYNTHSTRSESLPIPNRKEEKWLSALFLTDPKVDRDKLVQAKGDRAEHTCEWVLRNESFRAWRRGSLRSLWIRGGPGKGKTMISIFLTQHLENEKCIYHFCAAGDLRRNNAAAVLRGLLWHLVSRHPDLASKLRQLSEAEEHIQQIVGAAETLWNIFMELTSSLMLAQVFCILDGLDECDQESRSWLATKLASWTKSDNACKLRVLVVSRSIANLNSMTQINLDSDEAHGISTDVESFVTTNVEELSEQIPMHTTILQQVKRTLMDRSAGTFLWIGFAMAELRKAANGYEVLQIVQSQDRLPSGLPAIYGRTLSSIKIAHKETSINILRWVAISAVPLSPAELAGAVHCIPMYPQNLETTIEDQIELCGPLLEVVFDVRFVHDSVREYLTLADIDAESGLNDFHIEAEHAHFQAARDCLQSIENDDPLYREFREYAVRYWLYHAKLSSERGARLIEQGPQFFQGISSIRDRWWKDFTDYEKYSALRQINIHFVGSIARSEGFEKLPKLHMACCVGFEGWADSLIHDTACNVNELDSYGCTPLIYAILQGHTALVRLLIKHGADIHTAYGDKKETALSCAIRSRSAEIAEIILQHGASATAEDPENSLTPLMLAVSCGDEQIAGLLVGRGVNVHHVNSKGDTVIHTLFGSIKTTIGLDMFEKLFSKSGLSPNPDLKNAYGRTLLHTSASTLNLVGVQKALEINCDVNAVDLKRSTPLHMAAEQPPIPFIGPRNQVIALLLQHGADPKSIDELGASPLHDWVKSWMPKQRRLRGSQRDIWDEAAARSLLQHGADINACDATQSTALHLAMQTAKPTRARFLLNHGATINARDVDGRSVLHLAAISEEACMVEMLSDAFTLLRLLLGPRADINSKTHDGRTPLHFAAESGNEAMLKLLLGLQADVSAKDQHGKTALHTAASHGHTPVIGLLLDAKADVNTPDGEGLTALHTATRAGHVDPVNRLIEHGADVLVYGTYNTALGRTKMTLRDLAAWKKHTDIERILQERGVPRSFVLGLLFYLIDCLYDFIARFSKM